MAYPWLYRRQDRYVPRKRPYVVTWRIGTLTAGTLAEDTHDHNSVDLEMSVAIVGGVTPYSTQLQRSLSGAGSWSNVGSPVEGASPTFTDSTVAASTAYDYRAVTTDFVATEVTSNTVTVTTDAEPATAITITGPSTLVANVPRNYTYTPDGDADGIEVTPTTDGTGTFDPASDTFSGSTPLVFEYTATDHADSPHTLGSTDDGGLTNGTKVVTVLEEGAVSIAPALIVIGII